MCTWDGQNMGYFEALKDVLKLIDWYISNTYDETRKCFEELKQKIQGESV